MEQRINEGKESHSLIVFNNHFDSKKINKKTSRKTDKQYYEDVL